MPKFSRFEEDLPNWLSDALDWLGALPSAIDELEEETAGKLYGPAPIEDVSALYGPPPDYYDEVDPYDEPLDLYGPAPIYEEEPEVDPGEVEVLYGPAPDYDPLYGPAPDYDPYENSLAQAYSDSVDDALNVADKNDILRIKKVWKDLWGADEEGATYPADDEDSADDPSSSAGMDMVSGLYGPPPAFD